MKAALAAAKPTPKVAAQTTQGSVVAVITYLIITAYGSHLSPDVIAALPAVIGIAWGFAAGWLRKENISVPQSEEPPTPVKPL